MRVILSILLLHIPLSLCVTLYNAAAQSRLGITLTLTSTGATTTETGTRNAAYDSTVLEAPPVPEPAINTQFSIQLEDSTPQGASIVQPGCFAGLSIEFSVADQVIGRNSTLLNVPFLNLIANLVDRAGFYRIRVGGNTQDTATLTPSLPDGLVMQKEEGAGGAPTDTPNTWFTPDLIYMLGNVSALINVGWWLGIPLNSTADIRLGIAEVADQVLGKKILGFQIGNEPDLYYSHGHRNQSYSPAAYIQDFQTVLTAIDADPAVTNRTDFIGPNISGGWTPEEVWQAGFVDTLGPSLAALSVEHYPMDNCYALYPSPSFINHDPQALFIQYLSRAGNASAPAMVANYVASAAYAQTVNKPFMMFETNSASCGGFKGISASFGATLWLLDTALQMAYVNFSGVNVHLSGQDVYYNPFTPPPTAEERVEQWSVFATYYTLLVTAETLGSSNAAQVVDIFPNDNETEYTPAYAIYENGVATRVGLFNYVTDPSGASDLQVTIQAPANPSSVQVKYLLAPSTGEKSNITWAGQTFGGVFASDGRFVGNSSVTTVPCTNGACVIHVPAPAYALVFLAPQALAASDASPSAEVTFSTSIVTATVNTATVAASVLAKSNGHSGSSRKLGSTSQGSSSSSGAGRAVGPGLASVLAVAVGATIAMVRRVR